VGETATGSSVSPHTVRTGSTPLSGDRHAAKESREELLTSDGRVTVVASSVVDSTTGVNQESLQIGGALGEQLMSVDGRTGHDGRVVANTGTEDSVVRRLPNGANEELSDRTDVGLTPSQQQKSEGKNQRTGANAKTRRSSSQTCWSRIYHTV
jgi:hypothetical protein